MMFAVVSYLANLAAYILGYLMTLFFCLYLIEQIRERKKLSPLHERWLRFFFVLAVIFVIADSFAQRIFCIEDGHYRTGEWYNLAQIFTFGVMLYSLENEEDYRQRVSAFRHEIAAKERPIASMGTSRGSGSDLRILIREAENRMYEDKEIFHEKFPDYRGR